jgi:hypothetical protein
MLWISAALAVPLTPILNASPTGGIGVSLGAATESARYMDEACTVGQCAALGVSNTTEGNLEYRPVRFASLYLGLRHRSDTVKAASYRGAGWGWELGGKLGVPLQDTLSLNVWASYHGGTTRGEAGSWEHGGLGAGAVLELGVLEDGVVGWFGLQVSFEGASTLNTLENTITISLLPSIPVDLTGGVLLVSDPIGPPWDTRSRVGFGLSGFIGRGIGGSTMLVVML